MFSLTFKEITPYLFSRAGLDRSSHRNLSSLFNKISTYFKSNSLEFTQTSVDQFLEYLHTEGYSSNYINNFIKLLKHIASFRGDTFMSGQPLLKRKQKYIEILTPKEIKLIGETKLPYTMNARAINRRCRAIIYTLALTGMRIGELINLTWNDYINGYFIVRDSKTDRVRQIPISTFLKQIVDQLPHYPHNYIFGSHKGKCTQDLVNKAIQARCKEVGLKKNCPITAHLFRHSFITQCIKQGESISKIARIVGHNDIQSTNEYTHLVIDDLFEVVENHPLALQKYSFDKVYNLLEGVKDKVSLTNFPLQFEKRGNCIILTVYDK